MEGWLPCLVLSILLLGATSYKYRLPGLIFSVFLFGATASIYNIFLLSGLTYTKSTLFGAACLLLFSQLNSLNWLKLTKKYLLTKSYTAKIALDIARKKSNTYMYEFMLMLLIPGSFFVFLLPASLKEIGIVIIMGSLLMLAFWLIVSNFYLPKLFLSFAHKRKLWFSEKTWSESKNYEITSNQVQKEALQSSELPKKFQSPLYWKLAPLIFFLGSLGLILWLSKFELHFPKFFKGNQLLAINNGSKSSIETQLKGLSGQYRELKNIPQQIAAKHVNTTNPIYYLFPESVDLNNITSALTSSVKKPVNDNSAQQLDWTLQNTDAFSIMPALKTLLKLIIWSTLPLSCYCFLRFGLINTISLLVSSSTFVGFCYLFMLSSSLSTSNLFPEILLTSLVILLTFWVKTIVNSKRTFWPKQEEKDKKEFFKKQSRDMSSHFQNDMWIYMIPMPVLIILQLSMGNNEVLYTILLFLISCAIMQFFFASAHALISYRIKFAAYKFSYKAAMFFVKRRQQNIRWLPEEENVLGINL